MKTKLRIKKLKQYEVNEWLRYDTPRNTVKVEFKIWDGSTLSFYWNAKSGIAYPVEWSNGSEMIWKIKHKFKTVNEAKLYQLAVYFENLS